MAFGLTLKENGKTLQLNIPLFSSLIQRQLDRWERRGRIVVTFFLFSAYRFLRQVQPSHRPERGYSHETEKF